MSAIIHPTTLSPITSQAATPMQSLVDEFADLHNKIAADLDRYEALKKQLGKIANDVPGHGPTTLVGVHHSIDYSAPTNNLKCLVDPATLVNQTGVWEVLTVSTTQAKKFLSPAALDHFFVYEAGSRRFRRVR